MGININFGSSNHAPRNVLDYRNVFVPFPKWGGDYELISGAVRYIETKIVDYPPCNKSFSRLPLGNTLKEIVDFLKVWLNFIDNPESDLVGLTREGFSDTQDIGVTRAAMDKGKMYVVATIVHELAHVDGAPGTLAKRRSNAAERTLKHCLLGPQFDPNIFGVLEEMFRGDTGEALAG
jgi:hypothetical protein